MELPVGIILGPSNIFRFPKMGVPLNHPIYRWIFHEINHPATVMTMETLIQIHNGSHDNPIIVSNP